MTLAAVSDAGPLIHFAEIDSLELFSTLDTPLVPETVYEEVEAGGVPDGLPDLSYELVEADDSRVGAEELDAGERVVAAADEETEARIDRKARDVRRAVEASESGAEKAHGREATAAAATSKPTDAVEATGGETESAAVERAEGGAAKLGPPQTHAVGDVADRPTLAIRSDGETGIVVDAGVGTVEIDVDDGPTLELSTESSEDEPEPMADGGSTLDLAGEDGDTLTLSLDADAGIEIQAGDGPGIVLEADGEPIEVDVTGGPTIELAADESTGTVAAETGGEVAEESAEEAAEEAEGTAEEAAEEVEETAEEAGEEAEETAEEVAEEAAAEAEEIAEDTVEEAVEEAEKTAEEGAEGAKAEVDAASETATEAGPAPAQSEGDHGVERPHTSTGRAGEDAVAISLDLALDTETEEFEELVRALRRALVDEMLEDGA